MVFELNKVCYSYPEGTPALDGVSLAVSPGESVVILGANASGKSTLLHLMDGLILPASGEVLAFGERLDGKRIESLSFAREFRRKVGLLFQDSEAQLFCPTVKDEIAFGPLQLGLDQEEVRSRVEEMLVLAGLTGLADRPPYLLSGGEKKKVALASLLAIDPEVLLLDEPTGDLDPRSQTWLVELLEQLRRTGKTLVTATHDLSIVEELADRALVLGEDHRLWAEGAPDVVLSDLELLLRVNLIHEHSHLHGRLRHRHPHAHGLSHRHEHNPENPSHPPR
jgi:cobalt/nickel transport system ATP-binding protein